MSFNNRTYYIIDKSDLDDVDFSKVMQSGKDSLRYNVAGDKAILKWEGEKPSFIDGRKTTYTHSEILVYLRDKSNGWVPTD